VNVTHHAPAAKTTGDLGKHATATSWGSSGRRFKSCQPDRRNGVRTAIINSRVRHVGLMMRLLVTVGDHAGQLRAHELSLTDGQVVQGSVVSARNSVSRALLAATRKDLVADRGRVHREEGRRPAWSQHGDFSQTHRMRTCAKRARCTRRRRHPVRRWRVRPRCGERGPAQCVINCPALRCNRAAVDRSQCG
jgi:hypothetical protein